MKEGAYPDYDGNARNQLWRDWPFYTGYCTSLLLYGGRIKVDLDTVVILSGFASLLYHGQISQKLVSLSDRLTSDTSL